jgi:hypothetical protein
LLVTESERIGGKKVIEECKNVPKSLSHQREEEYAREEEKEGSKIQQQSRTEFLCACATRPRESTRRETKERVCLPV